MREQNYAVNGNAQAEQLEVSRVLRNTYGLLALTLAAQQDRILGATEAQAAVQPAVGKRRVGYHMQGRHQRVITWS